MEEGPPSSQVQASSHRKLLSSKAMVVGVVETRNKIPAALPISGPRGAHCELASQMTNCLAQP
jgi:hypothetical protein